MPYFIDWTGRTKESLVDSSLEDWPSFLENSPGETTPPLSAVSRWELMLLSLHTVPGLVVLCICWLLLILVLLFGSILLISWAIPSWASPASSTAVSVSESASDGWMARRLYCSASLPCDVYNPISADGLFLWKYETEEPAPKLWQTGYENWMKPVKPEISEFASPESARQSWRLIK